MKNSSPTRSIGLLFLILGIICISMWGYLKATTPTPSSSLPSSEKELLTREAFPKVPDTLTLTMGIVELSVEDLTKMTDFYSGIVGFDIISTGGTLVNLGENGETFLRLIQEKGLRYPSREEAGLYHTAIAHTSRKDLANRLYALLSQVPERYSGSADHTATEAFYFTDPEGNGLELYYDRPRNEWKYQDGKPIMGSAYIDSVTYIERYRDVPTSGGETSMGHAHLKVGDILKAKEFYENILFFDEMNNMGTALFVSRDGYHHHLGMNTWESLGAGKRPSKTYGLRSYELIYHDSTLYENILENLRVNNIPTTPMENGISTEDPWGNIVLLTKK